MMASSEFKEVFTEQAVDDNAEGVDRGQSQQHAEEMDSPVKEPIGEDDGFVVDPPEDEGGDRQGNEGEDSGEKGGADVGIAGRFLGIVVHKMANSRSFGDFGVLRREANCRRSCSMARIRSAGG